MPTQPSQPLTANADGAFPSVLPMRQRSEVIHRILKRRLDTVLPLAMREAGIDMWIVLCQEDDLDPVFTTLIPMDTWCPILQMLVFYDRGPEQGVERINISGTETRGLYDWPYRGQIESEQWPLLRQIVEERNPRRIGINTGSIQWAAGGLTHNLYTQLSQQLPAPYLERLTSAEPLVTRWLATLTDEELLLYDHVVHVARALIAECYSRKVIVPGVTTTEDLVWHYWQRSADLGLEVSFNPHFGIVRSDEMRALYGEDDQVVRPGDLLRCDVGLRYLRLNTDHQQTAYVRRQGEADAPQGLRELMAACTRLEDVFMAEFRQGLTGNEMLANILARARREGIPNPRVYSHSLGLFLHEPGPLIGLPWEQKRCVGRGDVPLEYNYTFTMELSVGGPVPEWGGQEVRLGQEEDVAFTREGCRPIHGRQRGLYLV
ncbi:MAG: M24 family metallopeptidase [Anaerolineae bacterium]|nr:M24 family metallopeptidase [Anaerolineae bacterium]